MRGPYQNQTQHPKSRNPERVSAHPKPRILNFIDPKPNPETLNPQAHTPNPETLKVIRTKKTTMFRVVFLWTSKCESEA